MLISLLLLLLLFDKNKMFDVVTNRLIGYHRPSFFLLFGENLCAAKIRSLSLISLRGPFLSLSFFSDSENEDERTAPPLARMSSLGTKRRVTFHSSKRPSFTGTPPTLSPSISSTGLRLHRHRSRTTSRSVEERISFRGQNPIYTAGKFACPSVSHWPGWAASGRPAWYDASGESKEAFIIGICGGSASGKTTVAQNIVRKLNVPWVSLVSMDSFYRVSYVLSDERKHGSVSLLRFSPKHSMNGPKRTSTTSIIQKHLISISFSKRWKTSNKADKWDSTPIFDNQGISSLFTRWIFLSTTLLRILGKHLR